MTKGAKEVRFRRIRYSFMGLRTEKLCIIILNIKNEVFESVLLV